MSIESILPFLSQFDPPQQSEGSLDPLGLYSIADALGVRLAPGIRERQTTPRFLTLALVGMVACDESYTADTRTNSGAAQEKSVFRHQNNNHWCRGYSLHQCNKNS